MGQELLEQGAAASALRGEQNPCLRMFCDEAEQGLRGLLQSGVGLKRRQRRTVELHAMLEVRPQGDSWLLVEVPVERLGVEVERLGCQHRPFDVVGQALMAARDEAPELLHRVGHPCLLQDEGVGRQIVEQGGQFTAVEEERQVVLHAIWRQAGGDILVNAAPAHVHIEGVVPVVAEAGDAGGVEGEFLGRQHIDARHLFDGHLGLDIEGAQGVDFHVKEVDAHRVAQPHGEDVHQRAPNGELAAMSHRIHCQVARCLQPLALGVHVESLPDLERKRLAIDEGAWRQPLHERRRRHHQNAPLDGGQLAQGGQPLGNDVLMRREGIVGQRLPSRKMQDVRTGWCVKTHFLEAADRRCRVVGGDQRQPGMRRPRLGGKVAGRPVRQAGPRQAFARLNGQRVGGKGFNRGRSHCSRRGNNAVRKEGAILAPR